ncbi:MAG: sensor histidine kinase KdpD [Caldilineaceae bacterium]
MNNHWRPDPDQLLADLQAEETAQKRGKLKIFLGYAAGVGKTYAMLAAAHQRKATGVDVVIAYLETHGRMEAEALAAGLEVMPRLQVDYRGIRLPEMDVDGVLARHPQLALVDELAHTNAPGSRHPKRYQDIEELLAAGINVYSTVNIQHLESVNDVIAQITGVVVRETIPDRIFDKVHDIELVDLPPAELIARLHEGKVYEPEQAAHAIQKFFRQGNLTALRELALRRAAERVDDQMRAYMQTRAIPGPWSVAERLLVCISPSPLSERLVRAGRRLADELNAEWFAIYVETSGQASLSVLQRDQVARHLHLAEELGAKTLTLPGASVVTAIIPYARQHNITKIIAGKPLYPRWREWLRGSIVDQLIRQSRPIDVYVISGEPVAPAPVPWRWPRWRFSWRYLQSAGLVAVATLLGLLVDLTLSAAKWHFGPSILLQGERPPLQLWPQPAVEPTNLAMLYLAVVVIAALNLGRGPSVLAAILSGLAFDFLFVQPYLSFTISDTQYVLTFFGLLIVGLVISGLTARVREQVDVAQQRTAQTLAMYELSRDLAATAALDQIVQTVLRHIEQSFTWMAVIFLPGGERLQLAAGSATLHLDQNERAVADWVFQHGEPAGHNTNTLPAANLHYLPLKTPRRVVGVLGVAATVSGQPPLAPEQRRLLEAFTNQAALAIERTQLAELSASAHRSTAKR